MIQPTNELELVASCKRGDEGDLFLLGLVLFGYREKWHVCYRHVGRTVRLGVVADTPRRHQRLVGDYNRSARFPLHVSAVKKANRANVTAMALQHLATSTKTASNATGHCHSLALFIIFSFAAAS